MALTTFSGGIHPPENKRQSEGKAFSNLSVPQLCYIPLQQHIGKPARPIVEAGEIVHEGQLIGLADGYISANVHASVPGKVVGISEHPTVYSKRGMCVVIEAQGSFSTSGKPLEPSAWESMSGLELLNRVAEAGVVGLGGAAFPTQVKLHPPGNRPIEALIINGAECEPYLTVDDMLMQTFPGEVIEGVRMALKILGITTAFIGVEDNKPRAIAALKKKLAEIRPSENIRVSTLKTKFPQGAEKQLIYSLTRREVPSGGLPMDAATIVQNVGTIFAIREAVALGKPLFERYVTVTGPCVKNPGNYKVRLGSRVSDVIEECGGLVAEPAKIIMGGPMCGTALDNMDIPVVKGTSGILVLGREEARSLDYLPCIRCGRCVTVCPAGLVPSDMVNAIEKGRLDLAEQSHPFDCIMCGSCAYVCPSRRPLNHFIKLAQEKLRRRQKE
ncbi:MAG TPA: electron transport complex subunit RsxC [Spirochaetota bacterium]|nr:electron transport complex subunit RsxC [Spirochaetota bacterium]